MKPLPVPAHRLMRIGSNGGFCIVAMQCRACGAVLTDQVRACTACGAREALVPFELSSTGRLHTYTIVRRSFPGVEVPFVAAVVALDGGGYIQGTLKGVALDPEKINGGMPVTLVFGDTGQHAENGAPFLAYHFEPAGEQP